MAYEAIKQQIVTLMLAPGSVIDESSLRDQLQLGRTPIREALQQLARERLVTIIPRRGMFVTEVSMSDLPLLYETRAVLETHTARLAAARGSAEHWDAMEAELLSVLGRDDVTMEQLMTVDQRCHEIMYAAADNPFLTDTLIMLYAQSHRLWHMYLSRVQHMRDAIAEHKLIFDALCSGDSDTAGTLIEKHIRAFQAEIQQLMLQEISLLHT